jgi:phosphatidylserine/phosphatidylglycerophosphate/cardiolipin synthase-like enzyme
VAGVPERVGRQRALGLLREAGGDRAAVYDLENEAANPIYVHAKVCVIDDVWAAVGSDNLNRRSWTHDSELACAVLDPTRDQRAPLD